MSPAARFARACVASPHHLASEAGLAVLRDGGNAVDAAVAANLTLGVVAPYLCGYGGDLFAIVWHGAALHAYAGAGRAPAAATVEAVRARAGADRMPFRGPLSVTVPGAVDGWFTLLERFGTRTFADLAAPAARLAREGFEVSARGAPAFAGGEQLYAHEAEWQRVYGEIGPGSTLRQPDLARTIDALRAGGRDAFYRGEIAAAIVEHLAEIGGLLAREDLAVHAGEWVEPLRARFRGLDVVEMPPPTQGVAALLALRIADGFPPEPDGTRRQHVLIEATKRALALRDAHVTDPAWMTTDARALLADDHVGSLRGEVDPDGAATVLEPGTPARGGTAYLCAADGDGMLVSLIQSNYAGFGSGVVVPGWGINLQNRGGYFSLDPAHANAIAPRKRTMHTLIPAIAFRDGRPWLVFGTMGGDGQAQTHLQLLSRIADDDADPQDAIDAPRWAVSPDDWSVVIEDRHACIEGLRARGHPLHVVGPYESVMGHAHAIRLEPDGGYACATDPRAEGAALGL